MCVYPTLVHAALINPRCACTARVTVVGSACLSVKSHLTSQMSNGAINERAYSVAFERQKICEDLPEKTAFKSYATKQGQKSKYANFPAYSWLGFSAQRTAKHQRLPNEYQQHSALPKKMPTDAASPCWSEN